MTEQVALESFIEDVVRKTWDLFRADAVLYLLAGLILAALGALTLGILLGPLTVGFIDIVRRRMRGEPATAGDVFAGMSSFLPALLVTIIVAVGVILGVMLLVVPAAVVVYLTLFVFHFVAYDKAGVGGSLS